MNEFEKMFEYADKYRLYRVYDLDTKKKTYKVEIFTVNELLNMFDFCPTQMIVKYK